MSLDSQHLLTFVAAAKKWEDSLISSQNTSYETFAEDPHCVGPENEQSPLLGDSSTNSNAEEIKNSSKAPVLHLLGSARLLTSLLTTAMVGFTLGVVETVSN